MTFLGAVVVRVDLRADLDFLDDRLGLVLARFPRLERGLVLELAVVHQFADRGSCRRSDFDQVQVCLLSQPERVGDRHNPHLLARGAYQPYLRYPDTLVDSRFSADVTSCVTIRPDRVHPDRVCVPPGRNAKSPARVACGTHLAAPATLLSAQRLPALPLWPRNAPALARIPRASPMRPALTSRPGSRLACKPAAAVSQRMIAN